MIKLFSRFCALCEEEKHVIIYSPFVPFHIRASIARHVDLQNVAGTLMDQPHEQESIIHVVHNRFRNMELGSQIGTIELTYSSIYSNHE
jgi:hypothetical protein